MLSVKRPWFDRRRIDIVQTADIDVDLVGIGTRHIEGMDAAGRAERVLSRAGVEPIGGQRVRTADELELFGRHDEMQKALFGADRAIAFGDTRKIRRDAETHAPAMATAR